MGATLLECTELARLSRRRTLAGQCRVWIPCATERPCQQQALASPVTATNTLSGGNLIGEVPQLRRYARVLTGNPEQADKLVLETLSCARREQRRWEQGTSLLTRLFTIMHGLHSDQSPHLSRKLTQTLFNVGWRLAA